MSRGFISYADEVNTVFLFVHGLTVLLVMVQVKENSAYQAVASNTSGTTPKELFEDVLEELAKQVRYQCILVLEEVCRR